jgi:transposase
MLKVPHQVYTAEFKEAAVQRVKGGQRVSAVARELGMSMQTLRNWLKASETGKLNGPGAKVVTAEGNSRVCERRTSACRWNWKSQKKRRRSSRRTSCEVRLD